jgi:hypothetical protein
MLSQETDVLNKLREWGHAELSVRAMILTGSRARPDGPVDRFSDYDLILAVTEAERFGREDAWQFAYGEPMVRWGDQSELYGRTTYFRGVLYADGVKVDYSVWPDELLQRSADQAVLPSCRTGWTRATGCCSTRMAGRLDGSRLPTRRIFPPDQRKRSTMRSSRSSGGARPMSPRASGATSWSLPSGCWTRISSS